MTRVIRHTEEVTRENQETDTIYVDAYGDDSIFVTPDGIGRYYFDSIEEAREEMIGGEYFSVTYYERKDD